MAQAVEARRRGELGVTTAEGSKILARLKASGNKLLFPGSIRHYCGGDQVRYWREGKEAFHGGLKTLSVAFDGTRVGGGDYLFSVLWSPELGQAL
eukprot:9415709-Lingulodinium_polyedra.AAC.1